MEIPILNRMTEFGGGMSSSQIFSSLFKFKKFYPKHFWKWSAVIIALLATFTGLINRFKILIVIFSQRRRISPISDDKAKAVSRSSPFNCSKFEDVNELPSTSGDDESNFRVKGIDSCSVQRSDRRRSSCFRRRNCVGEIDIDRDFFSSGETGSIVKRWEWDNVQVGFKCEKFCGSVISLYDPNKEEELCSIFRGENEIQSPATSWSWPTMVLSAGNDAPGNQNVSIKLWDTRVGNRTPAVKAQWNSPAAAKIVDVYSDTIGKVYLGVETSGITTVGGDVWRVISAFED